MSPCVHVCCYTCLCIGECPSNSPFLKNNGAEAPEWQRPIVFKEWRDTRTFSNLKSIHCTLLIVLIINLVTKKVCVYYLKYKENFKHTERDIQISDLTSSFTLLRRHH